MPYFHEFLEKVHLNFQKKKKKLIVSGEQVPAFKIIPERSYSRAIFLERLSFQNI